MHFDIIYETYKTLVFNLALQYTQQVQDAEEIMQDVFIKVYQKRHQFNEEAALSTWIYKITINASLDFLKAKQTQKRWFVFGKNRVEDNSWQESAIVFNHPGILLEHKESLERLFKVMNRLPDNQKTVLILLKVEGLTQKEVAAIMEKSEKGVESLFQRAKTNLRKMLDQNEG